MGADEYIKKSDDPWGLLRIGADAARADILGRCVSGKLVLDAGCGFGFYSDFLEKGRKVVGLDASRRMVSDGRRIFPALKFVLGRGESLPFASGSFDGALCMGTLIYSKRRGAFLAELKRVLKKKGGLCVIERNRGSPLHALVGRLKKNEKDADNSARFFTVGELKNLLAKAGFRILRIEGDYVAPFRSSRRLASAFPSLAYFLVFVCEKDSASPPARQGDGSLRARGIHKFLSAPKELRSFSCEKS